MRKREQFSFFNQRLCQECGVAKVAAVSFVGRFLFRRCTRCWVAYYRGRHGA